jgi:hypothetical protein
MEEAVRYPVCPHRNVPAAYARFHGPDSGGIARFYDREHLCVEDAFDALARLSERIERRTYAIGVALVLSAWEAGRVLAALARSHGIPAARAWSEWAAHPQLALLPGSRPILALAA